MSQLTPLFGPIGPEIIVILLIIILLFGANKIPKLARSSGEAIGEFRKGREEIEEELKKGTEPVREAKEDVGEVGMEIQDEVDESVNESTE